MQAKQLTGSAIAVGLLGAAELVPLVVFGLYGGVLADRLDRRRLIRLCEAGLGCCAALLVLNASLPRPAVWPLYVIAAVMMALTALQRPSLDASVPRVVAHDQLTAASALLSLSSNASVIAGSALGGALAALAGPRTVYILDAVSFGASLALLRGLGRLPAPAATAGQAAVPPGARGLRSVADGLRYARGRPELVGSYLVDVAAMTLAFPNALFPFMASELHAPWAVGLMYAAPSPRARRVGRERLDQPGPPHGRAIALAAAGWGWPSPASAWPRTSAWPWGSWSWRAGPTC